jgi:cytochrome c peroxidase
MVPPLLSRSQLRRLSLIGLLLLAILIAGIWHWVQPSPLSRLADDESIAMPLTTPERPIQPIIPTTLDAAKVTLGDRLFHDVRLSQNHQMSCATCHNLSLGGVDRKAFSIGGNSVPLQVNTPTVFNSSLNFRQNWDGRFDNLTDLTNTFITDPRYLGGQWPDIIAQLLKVPEYLQAFAESYPDGITSANVTDAIATFTASLVTPNARFDRHLQGDKTALTATEWQGYTIFKAYGCVSCHQGVNVGGNLFQKFGVIGDYFAWRQTVTPADWGRFNVTGQPADRFVFRVPSLRNVALSPPYFHDGSAETLQRAVAIMGQYQLGRPLSPDQIDLIVQFLNTLTGEYQGKPL